MREKTKCKIKAFFVNNIELYITSNSDVPIEFLTICDFNIFDSFGKKLQIASVFDKGCGHYSVFLAFGIPKKIILENSFFIGTKNID